jgi:hypothetical protein
MPKIRFGSAAARKGCGQGRSSVRSEQNQIQLSAPDKDESRGERKMPINRKSPEISKAATPAFVGRSSLERQADGARGPAKIAWLTRFLRQAAELGLKTQFIVLLPLRLAKFEDGKWVLIKK